MDAFRLDGRLALICGGSRGIGLGIAHAMCAAGADIIVAARASAALDEAAASLRRGGRRAEAYPVDLRAYEQVPAWYDGLVARHGRPDILVNAAGINRRMPAETLSMEDWNDTLAVNLSATFATCQAFARHLIGAGAHGKIINIASLMTAAARRTTAAYTASKGGVGQLTKALAVDWADKGIHVNAIAPGWVRTALTEPLWSDAAFDAWVRQRTPLARWASPEDIALPAVFGASPAADFITGQVIYVDGGWLATF
jgi:gluconate 5-dehydrogenase